MSDEIMTGIDPFVETLGKAQQYLIALGIAV
jgi:hypothetical protein